MSEYTEVKQPFLAQLAAQGWTVIDQGTMLPQDAAPSLRSSFRSWWLPGVFREAVAAIGDGDRRACQRHRQHRRVAPPLGRRQSDINMVMVHKFQDREEVLSNTVVDALGISARCRGARP